MGPRCRIAVGACADLLLFDPTTVGISGPRRVSDLPDDPVTNTRAITVPPQARRGFEGAPATVERTPLGGKNSTPGRCW
jgi:hypothetical protein